MGTYHRPDRGPSAATIGAGIMLGCLGIVAVGFLGLVALGYVGSLAMRDATPATPRTRQVEMRLTGTVRSAKITWMRDGTSETHDVAVPQTIGPWSIRQGEFVSLTAASTDTGTICIEILANGHIVHRADGSGTWPMANASGVIP